MLLEGSTPQERLCPDNLLSGVLFLSFFFGGAQNSAGASQTKREEGSPDRKVVCKKVLWYTTGRNDVEVHLSRLNYLLIIFLVTALTFNAHSSPSLCLIHL